VDRQKQAAIPIMEHFVLQEICPQNAILDLDGINHSERGGIRKALTVFFRSVEKRKESRIAPYKPSAHGSSLTPESIAQHSKMNNQQTWGFNPAAGIDSTGREAEMANSKSLDWKRLLEEVLTETDKLTLKRKAEELENALFLRSQELQANAGTETEREDIRVAIQKLLRVRVEKLDFPLDPNSLRGSDATGKSQK
jgi:hypothetical protein